MKTLITLLSVLFSSYTLANMAHHHNADHTTNARDIIIEMHDNMRFTPETIQVKKGENVRFIVKNDGKIQHELVLGNAGELAEHAQQMQNNAMAHHAHQNNALSLGAGKSGQLQHRFNKTGSLEFACLIAGHFEAGMKGKIIITE